MASSALTAGHTKAVYRNFWPMEPWFGRVQIPN